MKSSDKECMYESKLASTSGSSSEEKGVRSDSSSPETTADNNSNVAARMREDNELFAPAETKAVFWLRLVLLTILVVSTISVALTIYIYTSSSEKDQFEEYFYDSGGKVLSSVRASFDLTFGSADSFSVGLVSFARFSGMEWPYVTLPDYAVRLTKLRAISGAVVVSQYHLVQEEQRVQWQNYSLANDAWVGEGLEVQKNDRNFQGKLLTEFEPNGVIYDNFGRPSEGPGPFLPRWQSAPIVPNYAPYNWDGSGYIPLMNSLPALIDGKQAVISEVLNMPSFNDEDGVFAAWRTSWVKDFIADDKNPSEPIMDIYYPVIDDAPDSITLSDGSNGTVVGILAITIFWADFIQGILPPGTDGILCVVSNSCGQVFTYQINGPDVVYLGLGDLHDANYNHLELIGTTINFVFGEPYSGLPVSNGACPYLLKIYPSKDMEDIYTTNNPIIFTMSTVLIFAFTSIVFLVYDVFVERRQSKVMRTALKSSANVTLLEERVLERTSKLQITNQRLEEANSRILLASAAQLQHFACMSHEIRTPLNCIIGLSSLLQESVLDTMQKESMQMIVSSSDLLLTVVNDVLDYSKLESGNVNISIQRSNLQETLNFVVHAIETKASLKNVRLRTIYGTNVSEFADTDSRRLQQILYNLLGNAIKFSEEGGVVELTVSLATPFSCKTGHCYSPSDKGALPENNGWSAETQTLRLTVKDYGQGIAQKDFAAIFEPFRQAGAEIERVYGGTGLGLAISSKLVRGLGGSIGVDSEEGRWTEFFVDLPSNDVPVDIEGTSAGLKNVVILFVCNDAWKQDRISRIFRAYCVEFMSFSHMKELHAWIIAQEKLSSERSYLCIVSEALFDQTTYNEVSASANPVLITYGPKYDVAVAHAHYRSLLNVLPSVLIKQLGVHVKLSRRPLFAKELSRDKLHDVSYKDYKILIAEDNLINQKVLLRILNRLGIQDVEIVDNGQKAVDLEAEREFDVILMDMQMPVMDGVEACQLICQRQDGHPKAKIIFVTAHVSDEFEKDCFKSGASGFLPKPFNIRDIENSLLKMYVGDAEEDVA